MYNRIFFDRYVQQEMFWQLCTTGNVSTNVCLAIELLIRRWTVLKGKRYIKHKVILITQLCRHIATDDSSYKQYDIKLHDILITQLQIVRVYTCTKIICIESKFSIYTKDNNNTCSNFCWMALRTFRQKAMEYQIHI